MKSKIIAVTLLAASLLPGCSKDKGNGNTDTVSVQLRTDATLGSVLTDGSGHTLYYFANDAAGENSCTGGCETLWPVFNIDNISSTKVGSGLDVNDFKSITTTSGKGQVTYKGHPLYYYAPKTGDANVPEAPNLTGGESFNGVWFVAKPDYSIMLANAQLVGHDGKNYTSEYVEGAGKTIYFTDKNGVTLYTFSFDKKDKNNFTKPDLSNDSVWPLFEGELGAVPSVLDKSLFGSIDVFGRKQITYKGWPLYYFGQDAAVMGANKGISFPKPGIWPVAVKDMAEAIP